MDHFDKKYTVMAEGSTAKYIGIVLSGAAQIVQVDYYGNRSIFANIEEGNTFAEAFACAGTENVPITVIADEPSEIMLVDCSHILPVPESVARNIVFVPKSIVVKLPAGVILYLIDSSKATMQPGLILIVWLLRGISTILPQEWTNAISLPSNLCKMKPSPPRKPAARLRVKAISIFVP